MTTWASVGEIAEHSTEDECHRPPGPDVARVENFEIVEKQQGADCADDNSEVGARPVHHELLASGIPKLPDDVIRSRSAIVEPDLPEADVVPLVEFAAHLVKCAHISKPETLVKGGTTRIWQRCSSNDAMNISG